MILNIDVSGKEFQVTKAPEPKFDAQGVQRSSKETQEPLWATEVVVTDRSGGEILRISTAGARPDLEQGDLVQVIGLVAFPWSNSHKAGVAYQAESIKAID